MRNSLLIVVFLAVLAATVGYVDAAGNMTRGPRPGAESTATEGLLCVWDGWDRLARVYKDNGGGQPGQPGRPRGG